MAGWGGAPSHGPLHMLAAQMHIWSRGGWWNISCDRVMEPGHSQGAAELSNTVIMDNLVGLDMDLLVLVNL